MMSHKTWGSLSAIAVLAFTVGCTNSTPTTQTGSSETQTANQATTNDQGTLAVRANGEDFVRQGFTSKDGWKIEFRNVYATLGDVTAYQTDPPYDAEKDKELSAKQQINVAKTQTVDLKTTNADTVLVGEAKAPAGRYNALSWRMVKPTDGPAAGYPLLLVGQASKGGKTVDFALKIDQELAFSCGDFVGDDRKGNLEAGKTADLEATFHFDHLFGDAETPMDDDLNKGALGFEPLAQIASNGTVDANMATLKQQLKPADYQKLVEILPSLGHVGEGHCKETVIKAGA